MAELRPHDAVGLDMPGPGHDHRVPRAAEVGRHQLGPLERRPARPGPAGVVHVVGGGGAERVEPADRVEGGHLLLDRVRDVVLCQQLADRPLLPLRRRAVVAEDVEDQRVLPEPPRVDAVDQPPDLGVGMLDEAGEDLHQPLLERPLALRDRVPRRHRRVPRRQLGPRRDHPHLQLPLVGPLAIGIPAAGELALVLLRPLLEHVVRPVHAARRPVHEERLVRVEGAPVVEPRQRLVHQIRGQVIARVVVRRLDRVVVLGQPRLVLRGLAAEEAVEILEAVAVRPAVLRPDRRRLGHRRVVPLAEGRGMVAVLLQHLGDRRRVLRDDPGIAVPGHRPLGDRPRPDAGMVPPGEQRRPGRRADRGGVEPGIGDALRRQPVQRRGMHLAAEGLGHPEADVVEQHDQDVRRVLRQPLRLLGPDHRRIPAAAAPRRRPSARAGTAAPSRRSGRTGRLRHRPRQARPMPAPARNRCISPYVALPAPDEPQSGRPRRARHYTRQADRGQSVGRRRKGFQAFPSALPWPKSARDRSAAGPP